MRKKFLALIGAALFVLSLPTTVVAQRGSRQDNSREQTKTSSGGSSGTVSKSALPVSNSGSVQQRQSSTVRRSQTNSSSGNTQEQQRQSSSRGQTTRSASSGVQVQQNQGTGNARRTQQTSVSSHEQEVKSTVQSRRGTSSGNSNATVVERNNRGNSSFYIGDDNSSTGGRGSRTDGQNKATASQGTPHPGYSQSSPPPRGYAPNGVPPQGYRFTPPPTGLGCPVGYKVNTPPPPRTRYYDFRGMRYYFYDSCFHALIDGVYQVVAAPIGLTTLMVPSGKETLLFNNSFYYYYDGTFYRSYGTHYEVVAPCIGMTVSYLPNYGVSYVLYGNRPAYYYNGYYYYEIETPVGLAYRVVGQYMPY